MTHEAPGRITSGLIGHRAPWAKSGASRPVIWMLEIATGPAPVFVTVVLSASLLVPTSWSPNERDDGESDTAPARIPLPVSETV